MSKFCRKCGKELLDDSQFCDGCGTAVNEINSNLNQINTQATNNNVIVQNNSAQPANNMGTIYSQPNNSIQLENNNMTNTYNQNNNDKVPKVKKVNVITIICSILIVLIVLYIAVIAAKPIYRTIRDANTRSQIDIHADDEYIEIDQEKFGRLLANELEKYNIHVSTVHRYKGTQWADKYRFDIDLENGEKIYLTGNKENRIERIICRGDPKKSSSDLGDAVGVITMLLVPSTTTSDLENLSKTFFKYDNLNSMFGEDYRYGNLVYEWYWDSIENTFFQITIMTEGHYKAINSK